MATSSLPFAYDDGGRAAAGYRGTAGDCVARSIAIAAGLPYASVYDALAKGTGSQRASKRTGKQARSARNGINTKRQWFRDYMASLGFVWRPTMAIGSGCQVHLTAGEVPATGRFVVAVSKHYTALIDGTIRDTHDPQREDVWFCTPDDGRALEPGQYRNVNGIWTKGGGRCVYGFWELCR